MEKMIIFTQMPDIKIIEMPGGTGVQHQNCLHTLNSTAFEIFELCDGNRSVQNIEFLMSTRYSNESIEHSIETFLEQLLSLGLIREKNGHDSVHIPRKH
jgi:hypothetical protein